MAYFELYFIYVFILINQVDLYPTLPHTGRGKGQTIEDMGRSWIRSLYIRYASPAPLPSLVRDHI